MLEYWFKERRTLVDFRRGLLGLHIDGFAAYLPKPLDLDRLCRVVDAVGRGTSPP